MKLHHLTDKTLLADTRNLVLNERRFTLQVLHHLKEIDRWKLYSDLKCSSLFDYCVRELGYSESSAQRRIVAARLLQAFPEIGKKIESGALTLSNIASVAQTFKNPDDQKKILGKIEGLSKRDCEKKLMELSGLPAPLPREKEKRVSEDKVQMTVILSNETIELMKEVHALSGKNLSQDELIKMGLKAAKIQIEKQKFKLTEKPKKSLPPAEVKRTIAAHVKREVYLRDQKCVKCGSNHRLNFDHRVAYAVGGVSTAGNIRLLCFNCNQRSRMEMKFKSG